MVQQAIQESAEDHGVSDVRHLELVEAQDVCFPREIPYDRRDGVTATVHGGLGGMDTLVDVDHEGVKVDATFVNDV